MTNSNLNNRLFSFIKQSTSPFHAVSVIQKILSQNGFSLLDEGFKWSIEPGGRYFVIRNGAVIAFSCGRKTSLSSGFRIVGAHTDSPCFQIKPNQRKGSDPYLLLGVEKYGGPILTTWLDRELSLAGRVVISTNEGSLKTLLVDFGDPLIYIPSLAIHLNRTVNEGQNINVQNDLSPIIAQAFNDHLPNLNSILLDHIKQEYPDITTHSIIGFDLFSYDINPPSFFGYSQEFIAAPRLDNLLSCFVGLESILHAEENTNSLLICTNHEEIGSRSESGALGSFLKDIFSRLFLTDEQKLISLHNSFLLSLDNAHGSHPNYKSKSDPDHEVLLNNGPVIKLNANQRYSSTALTTSVIRQIASEAGINCQDFIMRSDLACGSTIGPITSSQLGIPSIDVGAPTWGMHSIREVTGCSDPESLFNLSTAFINRTTLPIPT